MSRHYCVMNLTDDEFIWRGPADDPAHACELMHLDPDNPETLKRIRHETTYYKNEAKYAVFHARSSGGPLTPTSSEDKHRYFTAEGISNYENHAGSISCWYVKQVKRNQHPWLGPLIRTFVIELVAVLTGGLILYHWLKIR